MAFVALGGLGAAVIYVGLSQEASLMARIMLVGLGGVAFWAADGLRRATAGRIELTAEVLCDGDGTVLAPVADILGVDRGVFAFKPSNGFLIRTQTAQPRGWRMGVWWRVGKRVGVGGMMPQRDTKVMAEQLALLIEKRGPLD